MKTMDISNKTLALFLLAAMVVSLGGTIMSLSHISDLSATGLVTDTGTVDLEIETALSITTEDDNNIDFGECQPLAGVTGTINSEGTENTSEICDNFLAGNGIAVRNNGNVDALVNVSVSDVGAAQGGTFLDSTSDESSVAVRTVDLGSGFDGGCQDGLIGSYDVFTAAGSSGMKTACSDLRFGASENSFLAHFQIDVPFDAPTGTSQLTVTFDAEEAP